MNAHNLIDLRGQIFGDLIVLKKVPNPRGTHANWLCECKCGNRKAVVRTSLIRGLTTSCGCNRGGSNKIDLCGERFGHLVVTKEAGHTSRKLLQWECKCDCGNLCVIPGYHLRQGRRKSCGCVNFRLRGAKNPKWCGYQEISGSYWHTIRQGARQRGIQVEITIEDMWDLFIRQDRKCALSGVELSFCPSDLEKRSNLRAQTASLDRIDSNEGYIKGNVQWVHKDINRIKMNMDNNQFIELCCRVAASHKD